MRSALNEPSGWRCMGQGFQPSKSSINWMSRAAGPETAGSQRNTIFAKTRRATPPAPHTHHVAMFHTEGKNVREGTHGHRSNGRSFRVFQASETNETVLPCRPRTGLHPPHTQQLSAAKSVPRTRSCTPSPADTMRCWVCPLWLSTPNVLNMVLDCTPVPVNTKAYVQVHRHENHEGTGAPHTAGHYHTHLHTCTRTRSRRGH